MEKCHVQHVGRTNQKHTRRKPLKIQRLIRYLVVALVSVLVFGGLVAGVWFLEI